MFGSGHQIDLGNRTGSSVGGEKDAAAPALGL
jgi:hypothetical protein